MVGVVWIICYYTLTISARKVPDLQDYQALIIQANMEYDDNRWMGYNWVFRLRAASLEGISWWSIYTTSWSVAFSSKPKAGRCSQCFSHTHSSAECGWGSETHLLKTTTSSVPQSTKMFRPVCYKWNGTPSPNCLYLHCKYEQKCTRCVRDSWVQEFHH